jgi:hypothetical protein
MALLQEYRMTFIQRIETSDAWKAYAPGLRFMNIVRVSKGEEKLNSFLIYCINEHISAEDAADDYIGTIEGHLEK